MTGETSHVTISLTAIHSRLDSLPETLTSLLAQDYGDFDVSVYLSRLPHLLDEGVAGPLPDPLLQLVDAHENLSIRFSPNIGPYRKILPELATRWGHRRLIATADDDTFYPPDWLARLVEAYDRYRCVVCFRSHNISFDDGGIAPYRRWMFNPVGRNPDLLIVPTGKDGILYDTDHFHRRVLDWTTALSIVPTTDDLWLKWHTAAVGVPTFTINTDYRTETFDGADIDDSLYQNFNRGGKNDQAVEKLEAYSAQKLGFQMADLFN